MKTELTNAFPSMPVQDKFGQIVFPVAGLTKFEYFAIEIYKSNLFFFHYKYGYKKLEIFEFGFLEDVLNQTHDFLKKIDEFQKKIQSEDTDKSLIV